MCQCNNADFVHLHVHSDYSLLDGACRLDRLVGRVAELGQSAVALTDHGVLFGAVDFYTAAKTKGVKPLVGCELYLVEGSRLEKTAARVNGEKTIYHLGLLAKNAKGYQNLVKLVSDAHLKGFYYKPRTDIETLAAHAEGLICFSGCLASLVPQLLIQDRWVEAQSATSRFIDIFGKENFIIELQDHGIKEQQQINPLLLKLAEEFGLKVVATNDVHYVEAKDASPHDTMLCIQTGAKLADANRMRFDTKEFYLKGKDEMARLFAEVPEAITNTREVADMCDFKFQFGENRYPVYPMPIELTQPKPDYLLELCIAGMKRRYNVDYLAPETAADTAQSKVLVERVNYELGIIQKTGFVDYFLIVWDFIAWAKKHAVPVGPGRGSGAGCLVAYLLGITDIEPLRFSLLFERFLNPERVSPPDFDIDFCMRRRSLVVEYVREKYGRECVANIVTFGTLGAKAVIRDVVRVNDLPFSEGDRLSKMIPDELNIDLTTALEKSAELRNEVERNPVVKRIFDQCLVLEGMVRNTGKHAAGIIIADRPLSEFVPLTLQDDDITTQYAMEPVQKLGLLKMDFLGLKTLTVIQDAVDSIRRTVNPTFDIEAVPLDDPKTFELLKTGLTTGVFQLESPGMQNLCRQLQVSSVEEIIALIALYRPGPMDLIPTYLEGKRNPASITYPHPTLENLCRETYGIMVYQEQVMEAARVVAGYTLGGADMLRRCIAAGTLVENANTGERVKIEDVSPGFPVRALGSDLRFRTRAVTQVFDNGIRKVVKVTTRAGRQIKMTPDHLVLTIAGWKPLAEVGVGGLIAAPANHPVFGQNRDSDATVKTLAYLVGDGSTVQTKGQRIAAFYNSNPLVLDDYRSAVCELGVTTKSYLHKDTGVFTVTTKGEGVGRGCNPVLNLITKHGIVGLATAKSAPTAVYQYDKETLRLFIGTLWNTDGSIERTRISYSTSSNKLLFAVLHILLRFGICAIWRTRKTYRSDNHEVIITDQDDVIRFAQEFTNTLLDPKRTALVKLAAGAKTRAKHRSIHLIPAGICRSLIAAKRRSGLSWSQASQKVAVSAGRLSGGINFKHCNRALQPKRVELLARAFGDSYAATVAAARDEVLWDKIESIEEAGVERVFDLCVPPDSNFVAGDIVVHNCMGKKNFEEMAKQRSIFVEGAKKTNDIPEAKALEIFALLEKFAGYGFNKSHSAAYAILSYRTAYLKANYPVHFMAGVLAGELGNSEKIAHFINEASAMGIEVMGPDINESRENFTPVGSKIRFGMGAIKGVGEGASQKVIAELEANGAFKDFHDCLSRMGTNLNRRVIECLVKTGAFDFCGVSRGVLFAQIEEVMSSAAERQRDVRAGQHSFLDMLAEPEPEKKRGGGKIVHGSGDSRHSDFSTAERLAFEKELLGFYISGHPLNAYCGLAEQLCSHSEAEVVALPNREVFRLCGVATNIQRKLSKKDNRPWSPFNLATKQGTLAMNMFADAFEAYGTNLAENAPVVLIGNILRNEAESEPRLNVKECYPLETALPNLVQKMTWVVKPDHPQLPGFLRLVREAINASFGSIKCEFAFAFEDEVIALAEAAPSLGWKLTIPKLQELARHPAVVRAIATPSKVEVKDTGRKWKKRS